MLHNKSMMGVVLEVVVIVIQLLRQELVLVLVLD